MVHGSLKHLLEGETREGWRANCRQVQHVRQGVCCTYNNHNHNYNYNHSYNRLLDSVIGLFIYFIRWLLVINCHLINCFWEGEYKLYIDAGCRLCFYREAPPFQLIKSAATVMMMMMMIWHDDMMARRWRHDAMCMRSWSPPACSWWII